MALVAATIGADGMRPTRRCSRATTPARPCDQRLGRPHDQELHAHRRDRRDRRRGRAPERQGLGQDRHRGAAHHGQGGADARGHRPRRSRRPRTTPRTPTPGSSRSRRTAKPSVAVAVLLVGQGAGGDTAAPAAGPSSRPRCVLEIEVDFGRSARPARSGARAGGSAAIGLQPEEDQRALDRAAGAAVSGVGSTCGAAAGSGR